MAFPYWDWTMPQYWPEEPENGCIFLSRSKRFSPAKEAEEDDRGLEPAPTPAQAEAFRDSPNRASTSSRSTDSSAM